MAEFRRKVPKVDPRLFDNLKGTIISELTEMVSKGVIPTCEQGLYALDCHFVFEYDESGIWFLWGYSERNERLVRERPVWKDDAVYHAIACRWDLECGGTLAAHELQMIRDAYDIESFLDGYRGRAIEVLSARTTFTIIQALQSLKESGVLGPTDSTANLTLLAGQTDNESFPDHKSLIVTTRALNRPEIADRYLEEIHRYIGVETPSTTWIAKHVAKDSGEMDYLEKLLSQ